MDGSKCVLGQSDTSLRDSTRSNVRVVTIDQRSRGVLEFQYERQVVIDVVRDCAIGRTIVPIDRT